MHFLDGQQLTDVVGDAIGTLKLAAALAHWFSWVELGAAAAAGAVTGWLSRSLYARRGRGRQL
jgi:hypothetical protein